MGMTQRQIAATVGVDHEDRQPETSARRLSANAPTHEPDHAPMAAPGWRNAPTPEPQRRSGRAGG